MKIYFILGNYWDIFLFLLLWHFYTAFAVWLKSKGLFKGWMCRSHLDPIASPPKQPPHWRTSSVANWDWNWQSAKTQPGLFSSPFHCAAKHGKNLLKHRFGSTIIFNGYFSYRAGYSTKHQVVMLFEYFAKGFIARELTGIVFLELSTAFNELFMRGWYLNFPARLVVWISVFLRDHQRLP